MSLVTHVYRVTLENQEHFHLVEDDIKNFAEKEEVHKRKLDEEFGSIQAKVDQIKSRLSKKHKAGGASDDLAELVTQMTDRNDEVKNELECAVCFEDT